MSAKPGKTRARTPRRRTEPRPRGSLSRDEILETGLRIAREGDLQSLTMQRLGDELGVTPMAVYRYFQNKDEIVDGVLDRFVEASAPTSHADPDEGWQAWLRVTFGAMRTSILSTPGVLPLLGTSSSMGRGAMSVLNEVLEVLRGAGFSRESAAEAFFTLMGFTLGACSQELAWRRPIEGQTDSEREERLRQIRSAFESQSRSRFPAIVDSAPELAEIMARYPFERGLDRILAALESELATSASPRRRRPSDE
jgi:AcrR family transcriptional regulator